MTTLAEWIRDRLLAGDSKRMTFAQFMEWALYHPSYGYYQRNAMKVGKDGDFYTNAHVGAVFGKVMAHALGRLAHEFSGSAWNIVEYGGGDGKLAYDILCGMEKAAPGHALASYYMVETSAYHREAGQQRLQHDPRVRWIERLDEKIAAKPLIVISNEFVDALPVHRLRYTKGRWRELYVTWDEERQSFSETPGAFSSAELAHYIHEEDPPRRDGQTIEVNLAARRWLEELGSLMEKGFVITVDYGYHKEDLWRPERRDGTLMCYFRHRAHGDPYVRVGEQDITSHVNFSSLKRWGETVGLSTQWSMTQREFLISAGILDMLEAHQERDPFSEVARRNRAVRQLIHPGGMGDAFKVLLQAKGVRAPTVTHRP